MKFEYTILTTGSITDPTTLAEINAAAASGFHIVQMFTIEHSNQYAIIMEKQL
jgi:hypothetical protein